MERYIKEAENVKYCVNRQKYCNEMCRGKYFSNMPPDFGIYLKLHHLTL